MLDVFAEVAARPQVPPTIHALLGARLDQLPEAERQVLEMAAVAGREFTRAEATHGRDDGQISGTETEALLARLVRRRILDRAAPGPYRFNQALLRDTAYSTTPKTRRERWHILLAERLATPGLATRRRPRPAGLRLPHGGRLPAAARPAARRPELPELASAAADVLISEGMRALGRRDFRARSRSLNAAGSSFPPMMRGIRRWRCTSATRASPSGTSAGAGRAGGRGDRTRRQWP